MHLTHLEAFFALVAELEDDAALRAHLALPDEALEVLDAIASRASLN